jgi:hypothetical protein
MQFLPWVNPDKIPTNHDESAFVLIAIHTVARSAAAFRTPAVGKSLRALAATALAHERSCLVS